MLFFSTTGRVQTRSDASIWKVAAEIFSTCHQNLINMSSSYFQDVTKICQHVVELFPRFFSRQRGGCKRGAMRLWKDVVEVEVVQMFPRCRRDISELIFSATGRLQTRSDACMGRCRRDVFKMSPIYFQDDAEIFSRCRRDISELIFTMTGRVQTRSDAFMERCRRDIFKMSSRSFQDVVEIFPSCFSRRRGECKRRERCVYRNYLVEIFPNPPFSLCLPLLRRGLEKFGHNII